MDNGGGQEADRLDPIRHPIDPSAAVRDRFDATALLLWLLRSTVPALLLGGLSYAWLVSETRFEAIPQVTTPGHAIHGNQAAMDGFVRANAGVSSPAEFFSDDNIAQIFAAASRTDADSSCLSSSGASESRYAASRIQNEDRTCRYDKNCLRSASVRDGAPGGVDDPRDLVRRA